MSKPCGYYTKEKCFEEASKYNTKKDFRAAVPSAYYAAQRNGWLKDYTWFVRPDMTQKWTYDACYEEAKKYTTIQEFRENNESCYISAWNKDWLKDYTWLKHADGGHGIWTKEEVIEEAKKYKTLDDFHKNIRIYNLIRVYFRRNFLQNPDKIICRFHDFRYLIINLTIFFCFYIIIEFHNGFCRILCRTAHFSSYKTIFILSSF